MNGVGTIDLNQTQPNTFYPQMLQSVQGGEEMASLDQQTAQKKYKQQLQAEMSKLKQKYQGGGGVNTSDNTKPSSKQTDDNHATTIKERAPQLLNNLAGKDKKDEGEHSPSPDQYVFM